MIPKNTSNNMPTILWFLKDLISNSFSALNEKKLEMKSFRNQSIIGLLLLVFIGFIVF